MDVREEEGDDQDDEIEDTEPGESSDEEDEDKKEEGEDSYRNEGDALDGVIQVRVVRGTSDTDIEKAAKEKVR